MKLLDSLLDAIVRLEGDALVMHVGEKPYVVTASSSMNAYRGPLAWGQVELSSRVLTFDAVSSMLGQILPADQQQALTEFGAIEHEIPSPVGVVDRFTVVAARGGEDVWVELRRRPTEIGQAAIAEPVVVPQSEPAAEPKPPQPAAQTVAQEAVVATPSGEPPQVEDAPVKELAGPAPVQQESASAPPAVESYEPAAEVQLQDIEVVAPVGEQPAAHVELDANSSIVVAIPGHDAQEIALNAVPENAIQIVDDEPQGVPTEEEVDAMLAATAGAILTSGMGEVVDDNPAAAVDAVAADEEAIEEGAHEENEIELNVDLAEAAVAPAFGWTPTVTQEAPVHIEVAESVEVARPVESVEHVEPAGPVEHIEHVDLAGPAFELSPPADMPVEAATTEPEVVHDAPVGTPLFSEEAVLAAVGSDGGQTGVSPVSDPEQVAQSSAPEPESVAAETFVQPEFAPASEQPQTERAPIPELQSKAGAAPENVQSEVSADLMQQLPEPPIWVPQPQADVWLPQLPAHVESEMYGEPFAKVDAPAPVEQLEAPLQSEPQPHVELAAPAEATEHAEPPVHAVQQFEPPVFEQPVAPYEPAPYEPAAFEPAMSAELTSAEQTSAYVTPPVQVEPAPPIHAPWQEASPEQVFASAEMPQQIDVVTPVDHTPETIAETADLTSPVIEHVGATEPVAPMETVSPFVEQSPAAVTEAREDANTLSQSAESVASEPKPPIEAPSVSEMTMEVTPELRQQEAPMVDTTGQAAEVPAHVATEPVYAEAPVYVEASGHTEAPVRADAESHHAVVVPLGRTPVKAEAAAPFTPSEDAALMQTLRAAAARGASTVYVVAQSKPMIRIDGEIGPLEGEPVLTASDVDRLVMELAPPRRREALQNGPVEWLCDVPEIGRVRCLTFRDHRGPGVLFRMIPPRAISADQLGLTPEVQALCQQSDGLVLVTGGRASGKSTLLNSFVDVINRTRSDYLITIESQIGFVHESRRSFISQRETRGDGELAATYARTALREDPDVMVIEDLKSADLVTAALEAAESGRLVLASVPAASTIGALERLIEVLPADRRTKARSTLATALRGVIAQVLLRRVTGGRAVAREILLNTPAVSQIVLEGKMFQLPVALDSGRRHGMIPLTDSLAAHVRAGTVDVAEAYRKALDRSALVALLKREGFDTSFAERLA